MLCAIAGRARAARHAAGMHSHARSPPSARARRRPTRQVSWLARICARTGSAAVYRRHARRCRQEGRPPATRLRGNLPPHAVCPALATAAEAQP